MYDPTFIPVNIKRFTGFNPRNEKGFKAKMVAINGLFIH